jgi:hypothetical protein
VFYRRRGFRVVLPLLASTLGLQEKAGRSTCSLRASVLTRPRPVPDLTPQYSCSQIYQLICSCLVRSHLVF